MVNESDATIAIRKIIEIKCMEIQRKAREIVEIQNEIIELKKMYRLKDVNVIAPVKAIAEPITKFDSAIDNVDLRKFPHLRAPRIANFDLYEVIQFIKLHGPVSAEDIRKQFNCKSRQLNGLWYYVHKKRTVSLIDGKYSWIGQQEWAST